MWNNSSCHEDTTESRTNDEAVATTRTETNPKSGTESEPETRITKPHNKTVLHVTWRDIYPTARDKGTGGEGRSDSETRESTSATYRVHVKTTGRNKAYQRRQEQKSTRQAEQGGAKKQWSLSQPTEISPPCTRGGKSGRPDIEGDTEISCRRQGYEIWLSLLQHDPDGVIKREQILNAFMATAPQGGEESCGMEPTERPLQLRWTPEGRWQSKSTGLQTGRPSQPTEANEAPTNPEERAQKTCKPQGEWTLENHPLG